VVEERVLKRDVDRLGLKGPVRSMTGEKRLYDGMVLGGGELTFDTSGNLVGGIGGARGGEGEPGPDGVRIEVRAISESAFWSIEGLHGMGFAQQGATSARTRFGVGGEPKETELADARGHVISRIVYICDENGLINEAIQYPGADKPAWAEESLHTAEVEDLLRPGGQQARLLLKHDAEGRLMSSQAYLCGQLIRSERLSYNDRGDVREKTIDERHVVTFDYQYDEWDNWVRRTVRHGRGSDEEIRVFTYYRTNGV
jgi:hypothetical protein